MLNNKENKGGKEEKKTPVLATLKINNPLQIRYL